MSGKKILVLSLLPIILLILGIVDHPALAAGTESYSDLLAVLDVALDSDDFELIRDLIDEDLGFVIAGQEIDRDGFLDAIHDDTERNLRFVTSDGITSIKSSYDDFLWGDDGAFVVMKDVTLTHFVEIERDGLFDDATMDLWEHGEMETAVIQSRDDAVSVYIFPDLIYKIMLQKIDGYWYLSGIAARVESD